MIRDPKKELKLGDDTFSTEERMTRFFRVTTAAYIAYICGMKSAPVYTSQSLYENMKYNTVVDIFMEDIERAMEEKETHLQNFVTQAMMNMNGIKQEENGNICLNIDSEVIYTNVYDIKKKMVEKFGIRSEVQGGRCCGIIEAPLKSAIFYMGVKIGITWSEWTIKRDIELFRNYLKAFGQYHNVTTGEYHAVIFVDNARMFEDLYKDKKEKNQKGSYIGKGFHSFTAFPMSYQGIRQLKSLLEITPKAFEDEVAAIAVGSGEFAYNEEGNIDVFPLRRIEDVPVKKIIVKEESEANKEIEEDKITEEVKEASQERKRKKRKKKGKKKKEEVKEKKKKKEEEYEIEIVTCEVKYAIGLFLDIVKCRRIDLNFKRMQSDYKLGIICYEWQKEYYQRIFPEAVFEILQN